MTIRPNDEITIRLMVDLRFHLPAREGLSPAMLVGVTAASLAEELRANLATLIAEELDESWQAEVVLQESAHLAATEETEL